MRHLPQGKGATELGILQKACTGSWYTILVKDNLVTCITCQRYSLTSLEACLELWLKETPKSFMHGDAHQSIIYNVF